MYSGGCVLTCTMYLYLVLLEYLAAVLGAVIYSTLTINQNIVMSAKKILLLSGMKKGGNLYAIFTKRYMTK